VYYNTRTRQFATIDSAAFTLNVTKGADRPAGATDYRRQDVRAFKVSTSLVKPSAAFFGSPLFLLLAVLTCLFFIFIIIKRYREGNRLPEDPAVLRTKQANKEANRRLAQAKTHLDARAARPFYDELSRAHWGYVSDKLNIPASARTWNLPGAHVYAGFIDPYLSLG
jgi:hypothetical protein